MTQQILTKPAPVLRQKPLEGRSSASLRKAVTRVAVPAEIGELADYRRYCATFDLVDVSEDSGRVLERVTVRPPKRDPQALPEWLATFRPDVVVLEHASPAERSAFEANGIHVVVTAQRETPREIARAFVNGALETR